MKANFFCVRHAESMGNVADQLYKSLSKDVLDMEVYFKWQHDPTLHDALLSPKGMTQTECQSARLNGIKLHPTVLVSPLRRTIQTACLLLKSHPQRPDLILKLVPEAIEVRNESVCSQPIPKNELFKFLETQTGFEFDTRLVENETWQFRILENAQKRQTLLDMAATDGIEAAQKYIVTHSNEKERSCFEPDGDLYLRTRALAHICQMEVDSAD